VLVAALEQEAVVWEQVLALEQGLVRVGGLEQVGAWVQLSGVKLA